MYIKPLSAYLHQRLLERPPTQVAPQDVRRIEQYIARFFPDGVVDNSKVVELPLPSWAPSQQQLDKDIEALAMPYINQVLAWLDVKQLVTPTNWETPVGWSQWVGGQWVSIEQPPKDCYMLDIETVPVEWYQFSSTGDPEPTLWAPVCSIALSLTELYVWRADHRNGIEDLDLLYPGVDGISIGHNIGYDLSYSLREHVSNFDEWSNRPLAVDTMGLWMVTRGHCNQQRSLVNLVDGWSPAWTEETTGASLASVYEFYFNEPFDKGVRDNIVKDGWDFVRDNYPVVLEYCYNDIVACAQVFQALMREWIEANTYQGKTQWLTLWSMMLLSQSWCPLDGELAPEYFSNAEEHYQGIKGELSHDLKNAADEVLRDMSAVVRPIVVYKKDAIELRPGMTWGVEFTTKVKIEGYEVIKETLTPREQQLLTSLDWEPLKSGKNKGLPTWYRDLMKNCSIGSKLAPIIMGFTWKGSLLYYNAVDGYHTCDNKGVVTKVANPDKRGKPVHSMLMKGFKDDARLSALTPIAEGILKKVHSTLNWVSLRKRVAGLHSYDLEGYPVFKDKLRPWGTVTRRSTSSVTQVLPKMDKVGCVGANVRALFKAPNGMKFITADFDSQELLLAAELGDAILEAYKRVGYRGSTPFSISCHIGDKEAKTTPHWLLSLSAQIDYTLAKNIGYAVIYGQSKTGSIDYFLMANKDMSQAEALERATTTHNKQKGVRDRVSGLYYNGAASPTYNNLNRLVASPDPRSLLSHQRMSKALAEARGDFTTTKQNWFIQESGSAMRDRLVVYSWYFMQCYNIVGRMVMTVHDEALYCVGETQAELMAYILQLAHLYIVAWKTDRLNLDILPAGQSYFSSVEVDTRWRKSVTANPPSTPDMPNTVWEPGRSLNPTALVDLINRGDLVI